MPVPVRVYHADPILKSKVEAFYRRVHLKPELDWDCLVLLREQGMILACGCRKGNILQNIAADSAYRGEGLGIAIVSELLKEATEKGITRLFLFTRPYNGSRFGSLGFFPIMETDEVVMMENRRDGLKRFLAAAAAAASGKAGCVVAHANPFTLGHLALLQKAAETCEQVYLFILSEKTAPFSPEDRFAMAKAAAARFPNVTVLPGGDYLISHMTFPDYFYPDQAAGRSANCRLDLLLFARRIAPALGIKARFVGEEPYSAVTADYNRAMAEILPQEGISVHIIPRLQKDGQPISATRVRKALAEGDWATAAALTPEECHLILKKYLGKL